MSSPNQTEIVVLRVKDREIVAIENVRQAYFVAMAAQGPAGAQGLTGATGPAGSSAWSDITGKPDTFPPSAHGHPISDVTGLQIALDAKAPSANPAITGGTIDNTVIGGTTKAPGSFTTLTASGLITATAGQIAFPATQNPSAGANTLDDYEEGTFTPTLTFATPGDLAITYSVQSGRYVKIGRLCYFAFQVQIAAGALTYTTASGALRFGGMPFTAANIATNFPTCNFAFRGINKATYQQFSPYVVPNTAYMQITASINTGAIFSTVDATSIASGGVALDFYVSGFMEV